MNLTIIGGKVELTPALREYVIKKLNRVIRRFHQVIDVFVYLTTQKVAEKDLRMKASVIIKVKGHKISTSHWHEDMYSAIDFLVNKVRRKLLQSKKAVTCHRGHGFVCRKRNADAVINFGGFSPSFRTEVSPQIVPV